MLRKLGGYDIARVFLIKLKGHFLKQKGHIIRCNCKMLEGVRAPSTPGSYVSDGRCATGKLF